MQSKGLHFFLMYDLNIIRHTTDFFLTEFNMSPEHSQVGENVKMKTLNYF